MTWSVVPDDLECEYSDDLQCGYQILSVHWNILFGHRNIGLNHHQQNYCIIILLITKNMENYVLTT
jgi:hypothetical protein